MHKIFTTVLFCLAFNGFSLAQSSTISVTSSASTFDTLTIGNVIYYQYAWDEPMDEDYPVTLKLPYTLKAFETVWDSMKVADGLITLTSSTHSGAKLILDAVGWDLKDKGWENDTLGLINISPITVSSQGNEVEWLNFGFSNELDTLNALPSSGNVKIRIDSNQVVNFIYGDFSIVRPDLCFEGLGSLHPSITYKDSANNYQSWFIHGDPENPDLDTTSNIAFDNLPPMGQKITLDFKKTNSVKSFSKLQVGVYPNPVTSQLNIAAGVDFTGSIYSIITVDGKLVTTGILNANRIETSLLKSGCYFLTIQNQEKSYHAKFIKTDN